jgi:hypothetical protein
MSETDSFEADISISKEDDGSFITVKVNVENIEQVFSLPFIEHMVNHINTIMGVEEPND